MERAGGPFDALWRQQLSSSSSSKLEDLSLRPSTARSVLVTPQENRQISERDDLGPPVIPGDRVGIPKPSPQGGGTSHGGRRLQGAARCLGRTDGGLSPLVSARRATRPKGEWGYSTRRLCWSPCAQRRCYPTGLCAYRPSVTSRLSINFLSLSLYLRVYRRKDTTLSMCVLRRSSDLRSTLSRSLAAGYRGVPLQPRARAIFLL